MHLKKQTHIQPPPLLLPWADRDTSQGLPQAAGRHAVADLPMCSVAQELVADKDLMILRLKTQLDLQSRPQSTRDAQAQASLHASTGFREDQRSAIDALMSDLRKRDSLIADMSDLQERLKSELDSARCVQTHPAHKGRRGKCRATDQLKAREWPSSRPRGGGGGGSAS